MTSRVDLWSWGADSTDSPTPCNCLLFGNWFGWNPFDITSCDNCLTQSANVTEAAGVVVQSKAYTGINAAPGTCAIQESIAMAAKVGQSMSNVVVYSVAQEQRRGDAVVRGSRRLFFPTQTLTISCADNVTTFADTSKSSTVTTGVSFGGLLVGGHADVPLYPSGQTPTCDKDYYYEPGWATQWETINDAGVEALQNRTLASWDGPLALAQSAPTLLTAGQDVTVKVTAGFKMPGALQQVGVQTRLLAFGVYAPN